MKRESVKRRSSLTISLRSFVLPSSSLSGDVAGVDVGSKMSGDLSSWHIGVLHDVEPFSRWS
jgi:hypothetical protein